MKTSHKLLAAVVVATGAYAATSWWLGGQVEAQYTARLERTSQLLAGKLTWQRTYRRGLFSSSQDWVISIPMADPSGAGGQAPVRVRLHSDIRHGPVASGKLVAAVDHTRVEHIEGLPRELVQNVKLGGPLTATTVQELRGTWRSDVNMPGGTAMLQLDGDDGTLAVTWEPAQTRVRGDSSYREVNGTTRWAGLHADVAQADRQAALTLTDWSSRYHVNLDADAWLLTPAHVSATVGSFLLTETSAGPADSSTPAFSLSNIEYDLDRSASGDFIELRQNLGAEGQLGAISLDKLEAEQTLERLDQQALRELQPLLLAALFSGSPQEALDEQALESVMRQLTDAGPAYSERISAILDGASGHLQWRVALAPKTSAPGGSRLALPFQLELLSRLSGQAQLQLPESWLPAIARQVQETGGPSAEALQEQLDALVAQGLLRKDGADYTLHGEYGDGRLSINGQTVFSLR